MKDFFKTIANTLRDVRIELTEGNSPAYLMFDFISIIIGIFLLTMGIISNIPGMIIAGGCFIGCPITLPLLILIFIPTIYILATVVLLPVVGLTELMKYIGEKLKEFGQKLKKLRDKKNKIKEDNK